MYSKLLLLLLIAIVGPAIANPHASVDTSAAAKLARKLVHNAKYGSFATISTLKNLTGYPMANIVSIVDDVPRCELYFMLTKFDITARDLKVDNRTTMLVSAEQDLSCSKSYIDPMSFNCSRTMLTGSAEKLDKTKAETEYTRIENAFVDKHPEAREWLGVLPVDHQFTMYRLVLKNVVVFHNSVRHSFVRISPADYCHKDINLEN